MRVLMTPLHNVYIRDYDSPVSKIALYINIISERVEETTSVSCSRSFISSDILQKMSAPNASEDDLSLASQCLALCQTLAGQGKAFSFSVTVGEKDGTEEDDIFPVA